MQAKILIIDDSPADIMVAELMLKKQQFSVLSASNGNTGLLMAIEKIPDLILLDVHMPDLNGFEVCRQLKQHESTKEIPVIFLTSAGNTESVIKGFESGAADYISKPYNIHELSARVKSQIELKLSHEELINNHLQIQEQQELLYQQRNQQLTQELDAKNKELTSSLMQLVKFSETINKILSDLENISETEENISKSKLENIIQSYKIQIGLSNQKEFETRFIQVSTDFHLKLITDFPELTNNELRLCAFLSLNMSSKDISAITLQTEDGIKKARYRLRKKLNLEEKDNLLHFLSSYK